MMENGEAMMENGGWTSDEMHEVCLLYRNHNPFPLQAPCKESDVHVGVLKSKILGEEEGTLHGLGRNESPEPASLGGRQHLVEVNLLVLAQILEVLAVGEVVHS